MNTPISTSSNKRVTFNIWGDLTVNLDIQNNPYEIPLKDLFLMAARINKKRSFLFVSKVLGKHIPIHPMTGIVVGSLLAARYMEVVKGERPKELLRFVSQLKKEEALEIPQAFIHKDVNPIIIGFAETATALGHAFFDSFTNSNYFHTTRELLEGVAPAITFEEEHSHATSHRVYVDRALLESDREIILVDDELTTGKTALNIIRSIQEKFPRTSYTVVSILDWRSDENVTLFHELEKELGITIHTVSLVKGMVSVEGEAEFPENKGEESSPQPVDTQNLIVHKIKNASPVSFGDNDVYTLFTGRFGLTSKENEKASVWAEKVGKELSKHRTGGKSLVLGSGEFMYVPMKVAAHMGENVLYHSSTRSPIYPVEKADYGVRNRFSFSNPEDLSIAHYLYNIDRNEYDDLFLFFEKEVAKENLGELLGELKRTEIPNIHIIYFTDGE